MQIGYDASSIRGRLSGVGHYTASLLEALITQFPDQRFQILSHMGDCGLTGSNLIPTQARSFPVKEIWMQLWLPRILARHSPDICHFTNSIAPLRMSKPYLVTVHDLSLVRHPEWHPPSRRAWMRRILRFSIARASGILCDSGTTRTDLLDWLSFDASRVWVVPLAARQAFFTVRPESEREAIRARYGLSRPFILYVGNIEPRKNLARLVEAFGRLNSPGIDLVLAGRRAWLWEDLLRVANRPENRRRVHVLDYVREDDLPALYQSALVFAYPSLMEGFGLPVLEAMASGIPVMASRVEPLASLVRDAGWLVRPTDVSEWQTALAEATGDEEKRTMFAARGKEIASQYSWGKTARETMRCYEEALSSPG